MVADDESMINIDKSMIEIHYKWLKLKYWCFKSTN